MIDPKKDGEHLGRISRLLYDELRRRGVDPSSAEDAVQEAWVRALSHPREPEQLEAWLRTVARRILVDHYRKNRCRLGHERAAAIADRVEPGTPGETITLAAIRRLPEPYREVLELEYEGLEPSEIAARLDRSEGTVRSQLKRGRDRLRDVLIPPRRAGLLGLVPFVWLERLRGAQGTRRVHPAALAGGVVAVLSVSTFLLLDETPPAHAVRVAVGDAPVEAIPATQGLAPPDEATGRALASSIPAERYSGALRGTVLTPDGLPAAGAEIHVGDSNGERAERVTLAGADGSFEIPEPGEHDFVWARRPGDLPSARLHSPSVERDSAVTLRLEPSAGPLLLQLVDERNTPLPEAEVELAWDRDAVLSIEVGPMADAWTRVRRLVSSSDVRGFVRFDTPFRERALVRVTPRDGASTFMEVSLRPGTQTPVLVVPRPLALTGTALDAWGAPVKARVAAYQDERRLVVETTADHAGRFALEGLMPGPCVVRALAEDGTGVAVETLEITAGESAATTLRLDGRRLVRGSVQRSGRPIAGATVVLLGEEVTSCTSGPDGGFVLGALEERAYTVVVFEAGVERPAWRGLGVRPGSEPLAIDLDHGLRWETRELALVAEPGAVLPTRIEARLPGLGHGAVFPVEGTRCRIEVLPGADVAVRLLAWFPRHGTWNMGKVALDGPDPVPVSIPAPVDLTVSVVSDGLHLPDDLVVALREPGFDARAWANELGSTRLRRFVEKAPGTFWLQVMPASPDSGVGILVQASGYADLCHKPPLVGGGVVTWPIRLERGFPVDVSVPVGNLPVPVLLFRLPDGRLILSGSEPRRRNGVAYSRVWAPPGTVGVVARVVQLCGVAPVDARLGALGEPQRVEITLDRQWESERRTKATGR